MDYIIINDYIAELHALDNCSIEIKSTDKFFDLLKYDRSVSEPSCCCSVRYRVSEVKTIEGKEQMVLSVETSGTGNPNLERFPIQVVKSEKYYKEKIICEILRVIASHMDLNY